MGAAERTLTYSERAIARALSQFLAPRLVQAVLAEIRKLHGVGDEKPGVRKPSEETMRRTAARLRRMGHEVDE
jgi:hypothetical protein